MLLRASASSTPLGLQSYSTRSTSRTCKVHSVACRASSNKQGAPSEKLAGGLIAGLAAASLILSPIAPALAQDTQQSPIDQAYETEREIQDQRTKFEFKLQQQENAKKAELNAQRQSLERQVIAVESALQQKLTEQKANVVGATNKGDLRRAQELEAQVKETSDKLEQIQKVAAQLTSQVDRAEILEKARNQAARQSIGRAANELDASVNQRLDAWLEKVKPAS
ncbi:hypothetical protein DUNSADRAFT_13492 [Dunaliella salina]|uniref:Uncharacterized protein n=1 Tax=Dunaliella salina TaxID=3046 RepID=A0ABQ7G977_DUNSA|nr:hypothetical protein DUNSADRAFT_13492 [Dunaliella salina]|eukprot:KAF5831163.1 hypothetical protein DUNSADRAFT_13492 [Dunaliella salina]